MRTMMMAALALAAGPAFTGAASAHEYGYLPSPAYVTAGAVYDEPCVSPRFTLAGARAGVTVLGVDVDAGGALKIGLHDGGCGYHRGHGRHHEAAYAPPPPPEPMYGPEQGYPSYPSYGYGSYGSYGYAPQPMPYQPAYAPAPCGCAYPGW